MEQKTKKFKQVSFAEGLSNYLLNQEVEIYLGDSEKIVKLFDYDINKKSVIIGTIVDIFGDMIVLETIIKDKKTNIFINGWAVKTIIPLDNPLTAKDVFIDQQQASKKFK
jgi:hypothetical protein